jgi:flagellar hook-length control protein FliK
MSSPINAQPQYGASAQSGLPPFMASQSERGSQAGDNFSRALQNHLEAPRERTPEPQTGRPNEGAPQAEHPQTGRPRNTEQGRRAEHGRRADGTQRGTERADAAEPSEAPAGDETAPARQSAESESPQSSSGTEAGNTAAAAAATAALPAAIAALFSAPNDGAETDLADTTADPLADVLRGGKGKPGQTLLPGADDSKGKSLQNALAEPSGNATRIASLVAELQSRGNAAVTAFTESPAKAMQALQGEPPTSLQSVFAPRAGNPLQPGPQLQVATPLGQNGWAEDVGSKVIWMTSRGESKAELVITPPNLGKVEVSINMNGDQASAQFLASTREAKEALEQALPRLRELMAQAGVNLGETSVNTSGDQRTGDDDGSTRARSGRGAVDGINEADGGTASAAVAWTKQGEGLVDIFA